MLFCLTYGCGVQKNLSEAIIFYEKSAQQKYTRAMYNLGVLYQNGNGVEKNLFKAVELYQNAVQAGEPHAMTNLAFLYQNGYGVEKKHFKSCWVIWKCSQTWEFTGND